MQRLWRGHQGRRFALRTQLRSLAEASARRTAAAAEAQQ